MDPIQDPHTAMYPDELFEAVSRVQSFNVESTCSRQDTFIGAVKIETDFDVLKAIDEIFAHRAVGQSADLWKLAANHASAAVSKSSPGNTNKRNAGYLHLEVEEEPSKKKMRALDIQDLPGEIRDDESFSCSVVDFDSFDLFNMLSSSMDVTKTVPSSDESKVASTAEPENTPGFPVFATESLTPRTDASNLGWLHVVNPSQSLDKGHNTTNGVDMQVFRRYLETVDILPFPSGGQSCLFCPHKVYHRRHDLATHVRTHHLQERRFECHCGAKFKRKGHLEGHIRMVHLRTEGLFTCPHCCKSFCSQSSKRKHVRVIHKTDVYELHEH